MGPSGLEIPAEFKDEICYVETPDTRSDEELLKVLTQYQSITSEKNVWAYWHSGFQSMPAWCQHNVFDWMRMCGPSWTIRVLDSVPDSPNNALRYLPTDSLPETFVGRTMDGPYTGPHSADFLRGACLYLHGGVFSDVGNLLVRSIDRICWNQLEDPESPFQVAIPWMYSTITANHFVASRKGDPFIKRWHDLFMHLWQNRTNHKGLIDDPLISFAKEYSFDDTRANNFTWDYKVSMQTVLEYVTQVVCWQRVCMLEDPKDDFNGPDYWTKKVLIWDSLSESWGCEASVGFVGAGEKIFRLLSVRRDGDQSSEDYKEAYNLTWRLLTGSSMQKITHGKYLTDSVHLGQLWDENDGKDCEPGTFAELLRYGTVHFQQKRKTIDYRKAPLPPMTLQKALLEA